VADGGVGGQAADLDPARTLRDDPGVWLFCGGTTGAPKAVVQTHRSFWNTTELYAKRAVGYREDDVTLSVPKLYFGYATGSNLFFPFSVGASAVLFPEHPTPEVLFDQIARHRPTIMVNVPSMIAKMVDHPAAAGADLSSLRFATSAGEALPASLYERWQAAFGVELLDGLGTAEMWHIFVSNLPGDVRPGTLGRAVPGFEVRVRDDDGRDVTPGEVGRLWVRGDSRAIAYWQDMPKTLEAFRGEWFVGGDLVSIDEDGYVTYVGRGDDALKVKGKWLVPSEVEDVLVSHPAVREAVVVGVTDDDGLTVPVAFVVADGDAAELEAELEKRALERLEPYKLPRRVHLRDDLPRTHLGKVDRGALKSAAGG
jgi:benzoate-CoA ligase family protein